MRAEPSSLAGYGAGTDDQLVIQLCHRKDHAYSPCLCQSASSARRYPPADCLFYLDRIWYFPSVRQFLDCHGPLDGKHPHLLLPNRTLKLTSGRRFSSSQRPKAFPSNTSTRSLKNLSLSARSQTCAPAEHGHAAQRSYRVQPRQTLTARWRTLAWGLEVKSRRLKRLRTVDPELGVL